MPAQTQTRTIIIKVVRTGDKVLTKAARDLGRLNKSVADSALGFRRFRQAFLAGVAALGIRQVAKAVDSFSLLSDRIKTFTGSTEAAAESFEKLRDLARFTKTSVEGLAQTYNRVALSTQELGISSDQLLAVVTALQQTFRLSGATIAESSAAAIQLSQGLSSGQLRGQELRSVLEQNAVFANLLSKELGITRGQLIKFAESGKITSDVVLRTLGKNFGDLNKQADKLGTTFNQSVTIAIDQVVFALTKLNKRLGISEKFAKSIDILIQRFDELGKLASDFEKDKRFEKIGKLFSFVGEKIGQLQDKLFPTIKIVKDLAKAFFDSEKTFQGAFNLNYVNQQIDITKSNITDLTAKLKLTEKDSDFFGLTSGKIKSKLEDANKRLAVLITLRAKLQAQGKVKTGLGETSKDLAAAAKALETIQAPSKVLTGLGRLNKSFREGKINIDLYNRSARAFQIDKLNKKFDEGKITVDQYNKGLLAVASSLTLIDQINLGLEVGLINTFKAASNVAQGVATFVQSTFSKLEDSIVEFVKTGKFEFAKFTQAVLDDLTRIIIRAAIIAPLANALTGSFAGAASLPAGTQTVPAQTSSLPPGQLAAAKGMAFNGGNVVPFANGGAFVSGPSFFNLNGGRTGVMGEKGPEAILPLSRGRGGRLGVDANVGGVTVNVINNTNSEVQTAQRTDENGQQVIDLLIQEKVNEGFATGRFDVALGQAFGIKRRGI